MIPQTAQRLVQLTNQLTEVLMTAAICVQEIRSEVQAELEDEAAMPSTAAGNGFAKAVHRLMLDQSTLRVIWRGRSLHLGLTWAFWLLERLSRRPNQYVTHLNLLRDVWGLRR